MDQLSEEQLLAFDKEYVSDPRWERVKACIDRDFPSGDFTFIDVGGGNGKFADRVLTSYANAKGTVLDSSATLLAKNKKSERKQLVQRSALDLSSLEEKYDIVFCNWLLHHLVTSGSYQATLSNMTDALKGIGRIIKPGGGLSIFENDYEGCIDNYPGRAIFAVTSSRLAAPLTKRLGANTAGVGVCFHSSKAWRRIMDGSGFGTLSHTQDQRSRRLAWYAKFFFLIRSAPCGHYWLKQTVFRS